MNVGFREMEEGTEDLYYDLVIYIYITADSIASAFWASSVHNDLC